MGQEKSSHLGNFGKEDSDMNRGVTWRLVLCLTAMLSSVSLARADYETGQTAWQAGRHAEALAQWREAAQTGDGKAMLALGRAFARGLGVPQDYVLAHMWLNLAAGRGSAEAARERDTLAANMIPQHIASAQERARAWLSGRGADAPKAAAVPRAAAPTAAAGPPPPRAIREAQGLMAALGYDPGSADGRWGPRTGRAYTTFLRDAGLPPGNVLTPDALRSMRAAAKGRNVTASAAPPRTAPKTQRKAAPLPADLHRLVAAGDVDGLKAALAHGADANARDAKGWTPLMHAADMGRSLLVPMLLKAAADPNIRASDGATALFIAAVHGHSEIIAELMEVGTDISVSGPKGRTAVDVAQAKYGDAERARQQGETGAVLALLRGTALSPYRKLFSTPKNVGYARHITSPTLQCMTKSGGRGEFPRMEIIAATERGACIGFIWARIIYSCDTRQLPCDWPPAKGDFGTVWRIEEKEFDADYPSKVSALVEAWKQDPVAAKALALKQINERIAATSHLTRQ